METTQNASAIETQPVGEDMIQKCATEFVETHPELGLTVEEVLEHSTCRALIENRAIEKMAEIEAEAEKAAKLTAERNKAERNAKLARATAILESERKVPADELEDKLSQAAIVAAATPQQKPALVQQNTPQIPEAVLGLKESHGATLMGCVYEEVKKAVLFRSWLISCVKRYREVLAKQGLEKEYGSVLLGISGQIQALINKVADVISAWGLNPKEAWFSDTRMYAQIRDAASSDERFAGFTRVITPEEMKELANAEVAEQQQEAVRSAAKNKAREKIIAKFTEAGFSADAAGKFTRKCVKNYFDECNGSDVIRMIRKMAINKMANAKSEEEKTTALLIAKAVDMSAEELETSVKCKQAIHSVILQHMPDFGAKRPSDRESLSWGAEKPETAAKRLKDNGGKKKPDGTKKKRGKK